MLLNYLLKLSVQEYVAAEKDFVGGLAAQKNEFLIFL